MASQIHALRELLERRFPSASPLERWNPGAITTGIGPLDRILPGGGLPRGHLIAWTPGGGASAVLRAACLEVVKGGERAAWVDGLGTVTADGWRAGPLLVRPRSARQALESAEELLRSGGVALLVLCGIPPGDSERVRLSRALREGGTALVIVSEEGMLAPLRVRTGIVPDGYQWRRNPLGEATAVEAVTVQANVAAPGWSRQAKFCLPVVSHDLRLSLEPGLGDRRGGAR